MDKNGIMDVDGLCDYLQDSRSTVYKLSQNAEVPAHKVGRNWRFFRDEIDQWLRSRTGASVLATLREDESKDKPEPKDEPKDDVKSTIGSSWDVMLAESGFSNGQIETLRAFSFDSPEKIMKSMATKAGRVGLCKALRLSEDKLDEIMTELVAKIDDRR